MHQPVFDRHMQHITSHTPPKKLVHELRKAIAWYTKGLRDSAHVRERAFNVLDPAQVREIGRGFFSSLMASANQQNNFDAETFSSVDKLSREVA